RRRSGRRCRRRTAGDHHPTPTSRSTGGEQRRASFDGQSARGAVRPGPATDRSARNRRPTVGRRIGRRVRTVPQGSGHLIDRVDPSTVGAMKVDGGVSTDLRKAAASAQETEAAGYDGAWSVETAHDPFFPLLLAAEHTERLELGTSIAVAFARNPMNLAHIGWDLQSFSKGRFILGLGSQIKPHITKRFSMEWSHPAPRMRELILAIRAIWDTWLNGTPLAFRGEFYTHTLMTPFFTPDRNDLGDFGVPRIFLAGVG